MAQVCVEYKVAKYGILQGEDFEAEVAVNGMNPESKLQVLLDKKVLKVQENTAKIFIAGIQPGEYEAEVSVIISDLDGVVFKENRILKFQVFPPISVVYNYTDNVLYRKIPNEITIYIPGLSPSSVEVLCDAGNLVYKGQSKYELTVSDSAKSATLGFYGYVGDRKVSFGSRRYSVRDIPGPEVFLSHTTDSAGKNHYSSLIGFKMAYGLGVYPWKVTGWKLSVFTKNQWTSFEGNTAALDLKAVLLLNSLSKGDKVILEKVKLTYPENIADISVFGYLGFTVE